MQHKMRTSLWVSFQRLPLGLKSVLFANVLGFVSLILPWTEQVIMRDVSTYNAFESFAVVGFLTLLAFVVASITFIQELFRKQRSFGFLHSRLWVFLGGQTLFMFLLSYFVFTNIQSQVVITNLRFGFFVSILAALALLMGGYLQDRTEERQKTKKTFAPDHMDQIQIRPEKPHVDKDQLSFADDV